MKMRLIFTGVQYPLLRVVSPMIMIIIMSIALGVAPVMGQEENKEAQTETTEEELIKSRMSLIANQLPDSKIDLSGLLRARIDGAYQKVAGEPIKFFVIDSAGSEVSLGKTTTNTSGIGLVNVNIANLTPDAEGFFSFLARFEGDDEMSASESDVRVRRAQLIMTPAVSDSTIAVALQATAFSPEGNIPIANATVSVYVKRMFSLLKIGEGTTDEDGAAELELPNDLPGDQEGNIEISAMIEETEEYGNLAATMTQSWGHAVSSEIKELPRALWSPNPPMWMVITFFILMAVVWGHYLVIVYLLFRMKSKKAMRHESV